jgi:hypothetical protein
MCAFIATDDNEANVSGSQKASAITDKLMELLKPKLNTTSNDELAQVFSALVLLPPQESKFVKTLELLTLRRSHTLDPAQISQLLKSYAYMG